MEERGKETEGERGRGGRGKGGRREGEGCVMAVGEIDAPDIRWTEHRENEKQ